jgi:signal transduction histidine kinase
VKKRSQSPVQPPRIDHLGWLYLLVALPILMDLFERGRFPNKGRELTTAVATTVLVFVIVNAIIRRSKALSRSMRAHIRSNEQLHHSNRLATVGQLAAGIAHELGSPLQVVAGRAKMVATGEATGDDAKESGRIIVEQTQRMTQIIRGLLGYARRQPVQQSRTNLETVAQEVHRMLGPIAKKKAVELNVEVVRPGTVDVDASQIQQALTNLVMNAIQAVPEGGHVNTVVDLVHMAPPPDHSGLWRVPTNGGGYCAALRVQDDGPGIDDDHKAHLFEPFFTTKDVGEGTGLGLAVAHGLVRENGGWISVESEVGRGARFSMFFPCDHGPR